jgi:hypothetical protein
MARQRRPWRLLVVSYCSYVEKKESNMLVPEYFGRMRRQKNEWGDCDNHSIVMTVHFFGTGKRSLLTRPSVGSTKIAVLITCLKQERRVVLIQSQW